MIAFSVVCPASCRISGSVSLFWLGSGSVSFVVVSARGGGAFGRSLLARFSAASDSRVLSCSLRIPSLVLFVLRGVLRLLLVFDSYVLVGRGAAVPSEASCLFPCLWSDYLACSWGVQWVGALFVYLRKRGFFQLMPLKSLRV